MYLKPTLLLGVACGVLAIGCIILGLMVIDRGNQYAIGYYQGWDDAIEQRALQEYDAYESGYSQGWSDALHGIPFKRS